MTDVVIATGKPYPVTNPERRASVNELLRQIASLGIDVEVEVVEYELGRRGIGSEHARDDRDLHRLGNRRSRVRSFDQRTS